VGFVELIMSRVPVARTDQPLVIHAGCGTAKQGTTERLIAIAHRLSSAVIIPPSATCCGMAGAHGLLHPAVVASATAEERSEVLSHPELTPRAVGLSQNTLCESALSASIGIPFMGLAELVWRKMEYRSPGVTELRDNGVTNNVVSE
jgi:D-lactate dehydrogenase